MVVIIDKERTEYSERTIYYAIVQMTDWAAALLGTFAWKLALDGELSDLKQFTDSANPEDLTFDELTILEGLDDASIGILMEVIKTIFSYQESLMLLYAIDKDVACDDEMAFELAELLYNEFVFPQQPDTGKFDLYSDTCVLILSVVNLLYVLSMLFTESEYDLNKDRKDLHFMDKYYGDELPYLLTKLNTDDRDVTMLADLLCRIERCYNRFLDADKKIRRPRNEDDDEFDDDII